MVRKLIVFLLLYSGLALSALHAEESTILIVSGALESNNINNEVRFNQQKLEEIPRKTIYTNTLVTDGLKRFDGFLVRDLLDSVGVSKQASLVEASALNEYMVTIPLGDFYDYDVLLATHMDGVELLPIDKGPLWIIYPRDSQRILQDIRYDYRWVWQLKRLHLR